MTFVKVSGCHLVNAAHIVECFPVDANCMEMKARLSDGRIVQLVDDYWGLQLNLGGGIVPALPGYFGLQFHCGLPQEPTEGFVQREPVVAWKVEGFTARPVTMDPDVEFKAVLMPDGRVIDPCDQDWPNEAEWLCDKQEEHARARLEHERRANKAEVA